MTFRRVSVAPLPRWLDVPQLLATAESALERERLGGDRERVSLQLPAAEAADLAARLRGIGIDGELLEVRVEPPLPRTLVRAARLRDARARRETTPGFTRRGAEATGEGRYSLTPEELALALAAPAQGARVLDACCGSGGNAIGFARAGAQVDAVEIDPERLAEARTNAAVYQVSEHIHFHHADVLSVLDAFAAEILFVDPPWGERYDKACTTVADFPLLEALLARDLTRFREVWLKVPSSFRVASVPGASARAYFGTNTGDMHRIKFLLLRSEGAAFPGASR